VIMKKTNETKEKLLQVAFHLIWDSSYGSIGVDDICKRAGISKGSFYHFFPSKADLVVAACDRYSRERRPTMDRIFSPRVPPVERLHEWCKDVYAVQKEKAEKYGRVCGCPYASIGSEVAMFDEKMRASSEKLMNSTMKYVENALADAIREGSVTVKDPVAASETIQTILLGKLLEARVQNDLTVIEGLEPTIMDFIGAKLVAS
jgi:TetR/AcrR family transcriptional regulator, transcriptional repressor for nem operon